ncbi:MAG: LPS export ABC transporter permease LptF [Acidobacteriota bacterium]
MKILRRYIFKEALGPFSLGLLVFSFVVMTRAAGKPLELLVQKNVTFSEVVLIFAYLMPSVLTFSIPMAVLLGILLCFGRLSMDSEVTAMRASGVGVHNLLRPVLTFALLAWLLALVNSNVWDPESKFSLKRMGQEIFLKSISGEVRPRVFEESFAQLVLYVQDTTPDKSLWKGVFLADISNRDEPKIIVARSGNLIHDAVERRLQLHLQDGANHAVNASVKDPHEYQVVKFEKMDIPLASATPPSEDSLVRKIPETSTLELLRIGRDSGDRLSGKDPEKRERVLEVQKRLALPASVLIFALLGVALGVISKRGGKSYGFVISLIIFLFYWLLFFQGVEFAKSGRISPYVGPWIANLAFAALAAYLLLIADRQIRGNRWVQTRWAGLVRQFEKVVRFVIGLIPGVTRPLDKSAKPTVPGLRIPLILDKYVIRGFVRYFLLVLATFSVIFIVFTFFELLNDIVEHRIAGLVVFNYFRYLMPQIIFYMIPVSVLVAVLVNFNLLVRTSQITAIKASGISLYRLSIPLFLVAGFVSASSFGLQEYVLPYTNQVQDGLRNIIKGRGPQTFSRPNRKWMMGEEPRIFYYNLFDEDRNLFGGLSVFELDPGTSQIKRRIYATRASWNVREKCWTFEDGWSQEFVGERPANQGFRKFERSMFPHITEPPDYFKKEVKESSKMTLAELREYILDLQRSGFDVVKLTVALHKKLSFPLVSLVMCLIAVPFSLSSGRHGSLYGIGVSLLIGITYWLAQSLFEQIGGAGKMTPFLAAWAPNIVFGAGGVYLLFSIKT